MNYNKVMLMGNLTRDPQLSYTPSQTAVVEFGMAINRTWKSQGGEKKEETCFVDLQAFGKTAENLNKYFSKGKPIFIEGRLNFSSWKATDGTNRSKLRVMIEKFEFVGGDKQDSQSSQPDNPPEQTKTEDDGKDIPF